MGRDSLALLEYLKDKWDECVVLFVDAGGVMPEIEATAKWVESRVPNYHRLVTNSNGWINVNGMPYDIVPVWNTAYGMAISGNKPPAIASSLACCIANIMDPMHEYSKKIGAKKIYRGQRNAEKLKSPLKSGATDGEVEVVFPLEDWSDEDVNSYLKSKNIQLPEWYAYGDKGFDCWWCTGFNAESKGLHRYLKENHADKWEIVSERLDAAKNIVMREFEKVG
jgi:phosphoadenosine phosphosulfate reductase